MRKPLNIPKSAAKFAVLAALGLSLSSPGAFADGEHMTPVLNREAPAGTQARQPGAPEEAATTETQPQPAQPTENFTATSMQDLTLEQIEGREVVNLNGKTVGLVREVVMSNEGETSLVVRVGSTPGAAGKDVLVTLEDVHPAGDQVVWEMTMDEDQLEELPEYEEAYHLPLSDDSEGSRGV